MNPWAAKISSLTFQKWLKDYVINITTTLQKEIKKKAFEFCNILIGANLTFILALVDTQNWHDEGFLDNLGRQVRPLL